MGADDSEATGVTVDEDNNVFVTGIERNANYTRAFHTRAYAAATGNLLWSRTRQSAGQDYSGGPVDVDVDSTGNVYVTGTARDNDIQGTTFIYTVKYAGATAVTPGATIWEQRSPATDFTDRASKILVDDADNVVVTGVSDVVDTHNADYYTAKYDGSTGMLMWEHFYDGDGSNNSPKGLTADRAGNVTVTGVAKLKYLNTGIRYDRAVTIKYNRLFVSTGDPAPGAGVPNSGIPNGSKIIELFTPSISASGSMAAKVTILAGKAKLSAIVTQGGAGGSSIVALQGEAAPGAAGGKYQSFSDPILAPNGTLAFSAVLTGVPGSQSKGVWLTDSNGTLSLKLQQGVQVPNLTAGLLVKSIDNISWRSSELVAQIKVSGTGVKGANSTMLFGYNFFGGFDLVRPGNDMFTLGARPASAVKSFSTLVSAAGSLGQGRSQGVGGVLSKVTLLDKSTAIVNTSIFGTDTTLLYNDQPATVAAGAKWASFGIPAVGSGGMNFVTSGLLAVGSGGVKKTDDAALVFSPDGATFNSFAREGGIAPFTGGAHYTGFLEPLVNSLGDVAFIGTIAGSVVPAITKANNTALWWGAPAFPLSLEIVARLGFPAPKTDGSPDTSRYAAFISTALPGGANAGPIFLAQLAGDGVNSKNNIGLFALDSTGAVRRLLRTGDELPVDDSAAPQTISTMALLQSIRGEFGVTRSFNETGGIDVLVTFTDKSQSIVHIGIP